MKLGYKILICNAVVIHIYFFTMDLTWAEKNEGPTMRWLLSSIICLIALILSTTIVTILHLCKYKPIKRIFVYANKADCLLRWANSPRNVISNEIIDYGKASDEEQDKRFKMRSKMKSIFIQVFIYILAVGGTIGLFTIFVSNEKKPLLIVVLALVLLMFVQMLIFGILAIFLIYMPSKIIVDQDKIDAMKRFDELDESIQITDYKIYPKEMYFEATCKTKKIYCLLTKKELYIIDYKESLVKKKEQIFEEFKGNQKVQAYFSLYNATDILCYDIVDRDIDSIMEIVSDIANKVEEKRVSLAF